MIEWISVDKPPASYGRYLITSDYSKHGKPGGVCTEMGIYRPDDKSWFSLETGDNNCITHWMPAPEAKT